MCGIVGFLDRTGDDRAPIGRTLLRMLLAVGCRGPDSAGVALYGPPGEGTILRIKLGDGAHACDRVEALSELTAAHTPVHQATVEGAYLRLVVAEASETLREAIEGVAPDVEVVSQGRRLEIVKEVGSPEELEATYGISCFVGTHGIGHTRLSTESRIDLSHSQPFWAHGLPDVATAHNGHITNYHKLRRIYAQRGVRFYTENDSELIGIYLRDRIERGDTLEEALQVSLRDFDGSFSYVVATESTLACVRDSFGLKPLIIAETERWVAVATEEIALRHALPGDFRAREARTRSVHVWKA